MIKTNKDNAPSKLFYQTRGRRPLIDRAEGIYIWDKNNHRYIDGSSGAMVANIGHGNQNVLQAMKKQMDQATFAYRLHFENEAAEQLAHEITQLAPESFEKAFFVSGGSEAVESCLKLARQYAALKNQQSRWKVISRMPSYHGSTMGALAITGYEGFTRMFAPMFQDMPKIPAPTTYLDNDDLTEEQRGIRYANMLEEAVIKEGKDTVLAFIMEPVGGASTGALVAPDSYYSRVREICDEYGILLIYDEVMSGGGRTGRYFSAEHWPDVVPDIIAVSKGLAAGYCPLGAMLAKDEIIETVLDGGGFAHGYTYAGNPIACSAGVAVLQEIQSGRLMENATQMGNLLKSSLKDLQQKYPVIGDVRGKGLLLAVELVKDRESMQPLEAGLNFYNEIVEQAYQRKLIIYSRRTRGGVEGDHFMVCPPMIVDENQISEIVALVDDSMQATCQKLGL